jgi:predicted dehydrogenase
MGIVLKYPIRDEMYLRQSNVRLLKDSNSEATYLSEPFSDGVEPVVAFVGAGNYASRILMPVFKKTGARLQTVVSSTGVSGVHHGKKAGFHAASTDLDSLWTDVNVNTVVIATRHNDHAPQVMKALKAHKNIFVEKPLALNLTELYQIKDTYIHSCGSNQTARLLMIGFNRRFAPHIIKMKSLLIARRDPKCFVITVNAGNVPPDHWTQDPKVGGGRIIGEGCHFIDLMRFLAGSPIISFKAMMQGDTSPGTLRNDKVSIMLSFEDGSFGTIHYLANGGKAFPKERIEVFCGGGVLQLDNFRVLRGFDWPGFHQMKLWRQDKGQQECINAFIDAIRNGRPAPIAPEEIFEVSQITIEVAESLLC